MKVVIYENKLIFIGKGKDIIKNLQYYTSKYELVKDWLKRVGDS